MYAIIKTGGKQYRVESGVMIDVALLNVELGSQVTFNEVLLVSNNSDVLIGNPFLSDYVVTGEVVGNSAGPKVVSLKYKPRQHSKRKWGHRQHYLRVKIVEIFSEEEKKQAVTKKKGDSAEKNSEVA